VPKLAAALESQGIDYDLKIYRTAGHSFLNDAPVGPVLARPLMKIAHVGPDPEAATHAWRRIESFFGRHLKR
jgi:carboxymethylenebutenolidase